MRGLGQIPRLADLIRQKAEEAAARRAPAAMPPDPDGRWFERRVGSSVFDLRATVARNDSEDPMPGVFEKLRLFVLSHNMPMTNTTGKLALFCAFLSPPAPFPRDSRTTIHSPLASPPTFHAPRSSGAAAAAAAELGTALPTRARFNDGRFRVTTEAQLRARARFVSP